MLFLYILCYFWLCEEKTLWQVTNIIHLAYDQYSLSSPELLWKCSFYHNFLDIDGKSGGPKHQLNEEIFNMLVYIAKNSL